MPSLRSTTIRNTTGVGWLDLLGTMSDAYGDAPMERLTGPDVLASWLADVGLAPERAPDAADVDRARELRAALRRLGRAAAEGAPAPPGAIAVVDRVLTADAPLQVVREPQGAMVVLPPPDTAAALGRIARQAVGHLTGPEATQLRLCAADDCSMLLLDPTGRRRWCSHGTCGVRVRVREHRRRTSGAG